jgi:hypothetical protein
MSDENRLSVEDRRDHQSEATRRDRMGTVRPGLKRPGPLAALRHGREWGRGQHDLGKLAG